MKIGEFIGEIRYEFNMAVLEYVGVGWRWRRNWRSGRREGRRRKGGRGGGGRECT